MADIKKIVRIDYKFKRQGLAYEKLATLTKKFEHFLSHDKYWALDDQSSQNALRNTVLSNEEANNEMISDMIEKIKKAKENNQDTTYMERGLAKYRAILSGKSTKKSKHSSFLYSWYDKNSNDGKHSIRIQLNIVGNVLSVEYATMVNHKM